MSTKNFGLFNLQLFADLPDAATIGAEEGAVKINGEASETSVVPVEAEEDTVLQIIAENYTPAASDTAQVDDITYTYNGETWTYESTTQVTTTETADEDTVLEIEETYYSPEDGDTANVDGVTYTYDSEEDSWTYTEGTDTYTADADTVDQIIAENYSPTEGDTADIDGVTYTYEDGAWTYEVTTEQTDTIDADEDVVAQIIEENYTPAENDTAEVDGVTYTYDGTTWSYDTRYTIVDYYNFSDENTVDSDTSIAAEGEDVFYDNVTLESGSVVNGGGLSSETLTLEGIGDIKNFDEDDAVMLSVQDDELKLTGVTGTVELDLTSTDGTFEQTVNGAEVSFDLDAYSATDELKVTISGGSEETGPVFFTAAGINLNDLNNTWVLTRESGYQGISYGDAEYLVLDSNTVVLSSENDVISFYVSEDAAVDFEGAGANEAYVNGTLIGGSALDNGRLYTNEYGALTYMNYTDSGTIYVGSTYEGGTADVTENSRVVISDVDGTAMITSINKLALGGSWTTDLDTVRFGVERWYFSDEDTTLVADEESGTKAAAVSFTGQATLEARYSSEPLNTGDLTINDAVTMDIVSLSPSDTAIFAEDGSTTLDGAFMLAGVTEGSATFADTNDGSLTVAESGTVLVTDYKLAGASQVEGGSEINTKSEGFLLGSQAWEFDDEDGVTITADESGTKAAAVTFDGNATMRNFELEEITSPIGITADAWTADVTVNDETTWFTAGTSTSDTVVFEDDGDITLDGELTMALLRDGDSKTVNDANEGSLTLVEGAAVAVSDSKLAIASAVEGGSEITTKSEGFALGSQTWDFSDSEGAKVLTADESGTKVAAITFDGTATMHNFDLEETTSPIGITAEAWTAGVTVNDETTWFSAGTSTSDTVVFEDDGDITLDGDLAMALLKDGDSKTVNDANGGALTLVEGAVAVVSDSKLAWATQVEGGSYIVTKNEAFLLGTQGWAFDDTDTKVITANESGTKATAVYFEGQASLGSFTTESITDTVSGAEITVWTSDRVSINSAAQWQVAGETVSDTAIFDEDGDIILDADSMMMAELASGTSKTVADTNGGSLTLVEGGVVIASETNLIAASAVEGGSDINTKSEEFLLGTQGWAFDDTDTKVITANESGTAAAAVTFTGNATLGSFTTESITDTVSGAEVTAWNADRVSINGAAQWQVAGSTVSDTVIFDENGNATIDADGGYIMAALANGDSKTVTDNDGDNLVLAVGGLTIADSETGLVGATAVEGGSDINTKGEGFALGNQIWTFDNEDEKVITADESGTKAAAVTFDGTATLRSFADDFDGESVNINDKATWAFDGDDYLNVVSIAEDGAVTLDGADNGAIAASLVSASDTESLEVTIADTGDVVKLSEGGAVAGFDFSGTSIVAVNSLAGGSDWSVKADMIVVGEIDSSSDTKEGTAVIFGDGDESGLKGVVTVNESGTGIAEISDLSGNILYAYANEKIDDLTVAGKTWSVENDINKAVMFSAEGDITVDGGFDSDAWIADAKFDYLSVNGNEGAKVFLAANNSVGMADFNVTTTNATSTGVIDNADFASVLFMQDADGIEVELEAAGSGTGITAINGVDTGADVWVAYDREFTVNDIATVRSKTDSRSIETIAMTITEDGMNVHSLVDSANYDIDGVDVNYGFASEYGYYASETKVTIGSAQVTVTTASADDLDNVTIASPDGDDIATVSGLKISNSIDIEGDDSYVLVYDNDKADSYEQVTFGGGDIAITARGANLDDEVALTVDGSNVTIAGVDENVTLRATTGTYKTAKGAAGEITEETGYLFVDEYGNIEAYNESEVEKYQAATQIEQDALEAVSDTTIPESAITYGDEESTTATVSSSEPVNVTSDIAEKVTVEGSNLVVIGADQNTAPVEGAYTVFGNDDKSTVVFGSNAEGRNAAFAGDAGDYLYNNGDGRSTLIGGAGDDTIVASARDSVAGGDGADTFFDTSDYKIDDYDATEGDRIVATMADNVIDVLDAIEVYENEINVGNGTITLGGATPSEGYKAIVTDSDTSTFVNLAWASEQGSTIDVSDIANGQGAFINTAQEDYLGLKNGVADSVKGSDYTDIITAGSGDSVDGGAGDDLIFFTETDETGAVVSLGEGNDVVSGWKFGYDNVDEGANLLDADASELTYSTNELGNIVVSNDEGSITFLNTSDTGVYEILVGDDKVAFVNGENVTVDSVDDMADIYVGSEDATLTFSENIKDTLELENVGNLTNFVVKNENKATLTGSDADEVVEIGGSAENAANKYVSVAGGDDLIISGGDSNENAANAFFFGSNDGNDTVSNINFVSSADEDETGDVITVEQNATVAAIDGNNVILSTGDSSDTTVTLVDAKDKNFAIYNPNNDVSFIAQVGTDSVSFDGVADYFYASEENASVTVAEGVEDAEIWLNNTSDLEKAYFDGDFAYLDASNVTGEAILVGDSGENTIIGGQGQSSLWGGYESNSELIGGSGEDSFMLFKNTGNTANVTNFDADEDMVWLYDYSLDDFTEQVAVDANSITMNFNDGSSMTINAVSGKTLDGAKVKVADGENSWTTYTANTSTGKWE